jgi:hypothetical protein
MTKAKKYRQRYLRASETAKGANSGDKDTVGAQSTWTTSLTALNYCVGARTWCKVMAPGGHAQPNKACESRQGGQSKQGHKRLQDVCMLAARQSCDQPFQLE